ncbi:MAG: cation transporter [Kosmotoga sp.]|jgi:cation diffusion facilitator family transporter|nr:MAG: cation transporter [Kosmotoga sp.]
MDLERNRIAKKASIIGIVVNSILAFFKITFGFLSGSVSILGDGVDSASDIITSAITLVSTQISAKPPDKEHPYGHERAETIATKVVSMIIFFAGGQLALTSIQRLFQGIPEIKHIGIIIVISTVSIATKFFLFRYKYRVGKNISSSVFIADAYNMRNDILISLSVLTGMLVIYFTDLVIIDTLLGMFVSAIVIKNAVELFQESSQELMDGIDQKNDVYRQLFESLKNLDEVRNPHKVRIRKMGYKYLVELDIEVNGSLQVREAHKIAKNVEETIKEKNKNIYDVHVHVEPSGNVEDEKYGVSNDEIDTEN